MVTWNIYLTKLAPTAHVWQILYIHTVISARRIRQRRHQKRFKLTILREPPGKPGTEPIFVVTLLNEYYATYVIFRDKVWYTPAQLEYNMVGRNLIAAISTKRSYTPFGKHQHTGK